jgi:probable addiction module antidote protein
MNKPKKIKVSELPEFDAAEYLASDEDMAAYLTVVLEEDDASALAHALGTIARARGMAGVAQSAGIGREALYKALRAESSPRFDTIARVCRALGVKLVAQPIDA